MTHDALPNSRPLAGTRRTRRVTLIEVAAAAGVSVASASRALTEKSASADMRERVQLAARSLGYVPDSTARSLKLGGTRQVIFAVDDIGNPNYVAMLRAIERSFGYLGPRVSVTTVGRDTGTAMDLVDAVSRGRADGLIISPIRRTRALEEALSASPIPTVVIGSIGDAVAVDSVRIDSGAAVALAAEHLLARGHGTLAFVNGPLDTNPGQARQGGFDLALTQAGIASDPALQVTASEFTVGAGVAATRALFDRLARSGQRIDGIVAANDLLAIAAINVALERGLRIPEDLAITGVDDTELAAVFNPPITSVSLQASERGQIAAELLEARFADPQRAVQRRTLQPTLHVRASTGGEIR